MPVSGTTGGVAGGTGRGSGRGITTGIVVGDRDPRLDAADERRVIVSLTGTGRSLLAVLGDVPRTVATRSGLTRAQMTTLHETLRAVTDRLESSLAT